MKTLMIALCAFLAVYVAQPNVCAEDDKQVKTLPAIDKKAKRPRGASSSLRSKDITYGYTKDNPIKVGSKDKFGGPKAEREYMDSLLDANGKSVKYKRLGSYGANKDGHVIDGYQIVTSTGEKVVLYIDMYVKKNKPSRQPVPVGFYKKR